MSWASIAAVVAAGLVLGGGPLPDVARAPALAELCTGDPAEASEPGTVNMARTFVGSGRIVSADPGRKVLTVDHDAIFGIMPAMMMTFRVRSWDLAAPLQPRDRIRFKISGGNLTIYAVALLERAE